MLKIYGPYRSRTFRVVWMCKELNIPFEHIPVTINAIDAQSKEGWFLDINPNGRVPAIECDGFVMWETAAINIWLAEKYKGALAPKTLEERGRVLQWAFYIANDVENNAVSVYHHRFTYPPEKRLSQVADEADAVLRKALGVIDVWIKVHGHLGLLTWDLSDFVAASSLFYLEAMKYDFSDYPDLYKWLLDSLARPAAQEAIKLRSVPEL